MSRVRKGPDLEGAARINAAHVADSSYTGVSLVAELLDRIKAEADRLPAGQGSEISFFANHAEWVALKLKDELTELDTAVRAAGWAG